MDYKRITVYQIYPQSFMDSNGDGVGDILGIVSKLDYLQYLGIDAIWICPMYKSPNKDNGYDVSDYYSFQTCYGTNENFDLLLKEAHKRNIKVIMDLVLNHTSVEHEWFLESAKSKDNPKSDWYIWKDARKDGSLPTNWGAMFGGPAWTYCKERNQYFFHTFSNFQPDLNWESESLKKELFSVAKYWIEKGVDGFRLDAINFISKDPTWSDGIIYPPQQYANIYEFAANGPKVHTFLQEFKKEVLDKYDVFTVGEASSSTIDDALEFAKDINLIFEFDHLCLDNADWPYGQKDIDIIEMKKCFEKWQKGMFGKSWNTLLWENHDQPRVVNRFRINPSYRSDGAKMLASTLYLMQGTPFIYQGQELGVDNVSFNSIDEVRDIEAFNLYHNFVDSGKLTKEEMLFRISNKSRATSRCPMLWNGNQNAGFTNGRPWCKVNENYKIINVENQIVDPDSTFNFYKKIIEIRNKYDVIFDGDFTVLDRENNDVFTYSRKDNKSEIIVISNFRDRNISYDFSNFNNFKLLLNNKKELNSSELAPYQTLVYFRNL